MDGPAAGPDLPAWRVLPALALAALADARCASLAPTTTPPAPPDAVAAARLARGVADLTAALGDARRCGGVPLDPHRALTTTAEVTALLAEAARHVAWTAGFSGQEQAAEVADAIMTTAWALRVLAELGLRVVPAPDAGERAPGRDPAP
ncbi:hypothetical protein [Actinomycetospora soli]|uniref:hypothetical protein n=1 Tax=Actinomycetospora soli TaxID=2893887 RepID=UPI001E437A39|nr:hypothetical protein [Actinomycetospora soli]MCD2190155.1 hypothetical protein [Actinomycetospora soli]